jgi:hypothetical protein
VGPPTLPDELVLISILLAGSAPLFYYNADTAVGSGRRET